MKIVWFICMPESCRLSLRESNFYILPAGVRAFLSKVDDFLAGGKQDMERQCRKRKTAVPGASG